MRAAGNLHTVFVTNPMISLHCNSHSIKCTYSAMSYWREAKILRHPRHRKKKFKSFHTTDNSRNSKWQYLWPSPDREIPSFLKSGIELNWFAESVFTSSKLSIYVLRSFLFSFIKTEFGDSPHKNWISRFPEIEKHLRGSYIPFKTSRVVEYSNIWESISGLWREALQ